MPVPLADLIVISIFIIRIIELAHYIHIETIVGLIKIYREPEPDTPLDTLDWFDEFYNIDLDSDSDSDPDRQLE